MSWAKETCTTSKTFLLRTAWRPIFDKLQKRHRSTRGFQVLGIKATGSAWKVEETFMNWLYFIIGFFLYLPLLNESIYLGDQEIHLPLFFDWIEWIGNTGPHSSQCNFFVFRLCLVYHLTFNLKLCLLLSVLRFCKFWPFV